MRALRLLSEQPQLVEQVLPDPAPGPGEVLVDVRSAGICHYCGNKFPPRALTMDHIVPIARGGKSTKGNVAAVCKECNNKKKHSLLMEWERQF